MSGALRVSVDARYLRRAGVGIAVYVDGLVRNLCAQGAVVTLLTDGDDQVQPLRARYGLAVVSLPERSGFRWEQVLLPRYLRSETFDVHIAGANWGLPLRRTKGTHAVLVVHDLVPLRMRREYLWCRPLWAVKYLVSSAISLLLANRIVAVSHSTARDVGRVARRRKVVVRYPPFDPHSPAVPGPGVQGLASGFVLYHGGFDRRKNVPLLIDAFALYRARGGDRTLVLLGDGGAELDARIERVGLTDAVQCLGYVDATVRDGLIENAGAVVYPSSFEGFGFPVVEALRAGVPIVTGTGGSLSEVGGDVAVYVDVDDVSSIADGIARALEPDARGHAAEHGPPHVARLARTRDDVSLLAVVGGD